MSCTYNYADFSTEKLRFSSNYEDPSNLKNIEVHFGLLFNILDGIGEHFPNLQELKVKENIKFVKKQNFANMTKLRVLDLSYNPLRSLDEDVFEDLETLEVLDLRYCRLSNLSLKLFHNQRKLKKIALANNLMTHLDEKLFINNQELEVIWLYENRLKQINIDFTNFEKMRQILLLKNVCINSNFGDDRYWFRTSEAETSLDELQKIINQNCYEIEDSETATVKFYCM
jgi:Leucine-rich repeat (LRR) protein